MKRRRMDNRRSGWMSGEYNKGRGERRYVFPAGTILWVQPQEWGQTEEEGQPVMRSNEA